MQEFHADRRQAQPFAHHAVRAQADEEMLTIPEDSRRVPVGDADSHGGGDSVITGGEVNPQRRRHAPVDALFLLNADLIVCGGRIELPAKALHPRP